MANSLVGANTKACTAFLFALNLSIIGSPNAAVLPVPVWACPTISFSPFKSKGIVCSCIGVGFYSFRDRERGKKSWGSKVKYGSGSTRFDA